MNRSFLLALGAAFLGSTAAAQGPALTFDIDGAASQFTYSGSTSLGPIVGNPNTFGLTGTVVAQLGAGLTGPIGTIQFVPGGAAAVAPDIDAVIPNPIVFLPPLAQITITGLVLGLESGPITVGPTGTFSGIAVATIQAGVVTITPFGSSPTTTDLAGDQSDPQMVTGTIGTAGSVATITAPLNLPFTLMDPATGLTATVDLMGNIAASHTFPQPSNYCIAVPNSTGISAAIGTTGMPNLSSGNLELTATALPQNSLGFFLFSADQGFVPTFGGSSGNLCLGGQLYRLSNFVLSSGGSGQVALPLPYGGLPAGLAFEIGTEWNFQYWFRDQAGGVATSNTTDGISVVFAP